MRGQEHDLVETTSPILHQSCCAGIARAGIEIAPKHLADRHRWACLLPAVVAAVLFFGPRAQAQDPRVIISPSGVMLKDAKPYRAVGGSDFFDSYEWFEFNGESCLQTFADLKGSGMKVVRLTAKGYWSNWKVASLYITDKAAYFAKMDAMIDVAAQNDIGVILGLFWGIRAISDHYGEHEMAASVPGDTGGERIIGLREYMGMAQAVGKPLISGEIGRLPVSRSNPEVWTQTPDYFDSYQDVEAVLPWIEDLLKEIIASRVQVSYLWAYHSDRAMDQGNPQRMDFSI